jgi:hypothetical protein
MVWSTKTRTTDRFSLADTDAAPARWPPPRCVVAGHSVSRLRESAGCRSPETVPSTCRAVNISTKVSKVIAKKPPTPLASRSVEIVADSPASRVSTPHPGPPDRRLSTSANSCPVPTAAVQRVCPTGSRSAAPHPRTPARSDNSRPDAVIDVSGGCRFQDARARCTSRETPLTRSTYGIYGKRTSSSCSIREEMSPPNGARVSAASCASRTLFTMARMNAQFAIGAQ